MSPAAGVAGSFLRAGLAAEVASGAGSHVASGSPIHLLASRCDGCSRVHFPARPECPACGGSTCATPLQNQAELGGCTAVLHPPPGALVEVPYLVGVARFPEGISIMGLVVGVSETPPPGSAVRTVATALPGGHLAYAFSPIPATT